MVPGEGQGPLHCHDKERDVPPPEPVKGVTSHKDSSPKLRAGGFTAECLQTVEAWLPFCSLNALQYFHLLPVAVSFCSKVLLDDQPD